MMPVFDMEIIMLKKRFSLILGAITAFSVNAHALPHYASGFELAVEGLYLRPNADFLQYAAVTPNPLLSPTFVTPIRVKKLAPSFNIGYGAFVSYQFPCSYNDVKLRWQGFTTPDEDHYAAQASEALQVPFVLGSGLVYQLARSKVTFRYDMVDLNAGHLYHFSPCFLSRFYAGLKYARVERDFHIRLEQPLSLAVPIGSLDITSKVRFKGIGPQVGMDNVYYFLPAFGIESDLSISGIVENAKAGTTAIATPTDGSTAFTTIITPDDQKKITPTVDARLGVQYRYRFCNGTSLKLSLGYQYTYYIGAFNEIAVSTSVGGISSTDFRKIDACFYGPYLTLAVKI